MDDVDDFMAAHGLSIRKVPVEGRRGAFGHEVRDETRGRSLSGALRDEATAREFVAANARIFEGARTRGLDLPRPEVVTGHFSAMRHFASRLYEQMEELAFEIVRWERDLVRNPDDVSVADLVRRRRDRLGLTLAHDEAVRGAAERALADPAAAFLPVGATVRVRAPESRPNALKGGDMPRPAPGSTGVVLGLPDGSSEWGVLVAFRDYVDAKGDRWEGRDRNPLRFGYEARDLEVVSVGAFHDGTESRGIEYVETHANVGAVTETREMVVISDGAAWRIHRFPSALGGSLFEASAYPDVGSLPFLEPLWEAEGPAPTPR
jgi:hypothetical protein